MLFEHFLPSRRVNIPLSGSSGGVVTQLHPELVNGAMRRWSGDDTRLVPPHPWF
jgi:hypothetical protein